MALALLGLLYFKRVAAFCVNAPQYATERKNDLSVHNGFGHYTRFHSFINRRWNLIWSNNGPNVDTDVGCILSNNDVCLTVNTKTCFNSSPRDVGVCRLMRHSL